MQPTSIGQYPSWPVHIPIFTLLLHEIYQIRKFTFAA